MHQILHVIIRPLTTTWRAHRYCYYRYHHCIPILQKETEAQKGRKWLLNRKSDHWNISLGGGQALIHCSSSWDQAKSLKIMVGAMEKTKPDREGSEKDHGLVLDEYWMGWLGKAWEDGARLRSGQWKVPELWCSPRRANGSFWQEGVNALPVP